MSLLRRIGYELRRHAPFTALGALTGILLLGIMVFIELSSGTSHTIFHVLHPAHIVLSALVTTAIYRRYEGNIVAAVGIGLIGSITICSMSDIVFPYLGGALLGIPITFHACLIEHTWLVAISALAGVGFGLFRPWTRIPHAGHVLLSTYASLFYFTTWGVPADWFPLLPLIFLVLFIAVWIPCCLSDIVFPLLFVGKKKHH